MKTFIRTIVVLVVLNLATGCFALSENVSEREKMGSAKEDMKKADQKMKESEQKMRAAKQYEEMAERLEENAEEMAERVAEDVERRVEKIVVPQPRVRGTRSTRGLRSFSVQHGGSGQIFVVPASEMKAEDLIAIVEDMRVMSRIFDKELGSSQRGISLGAGFDFNFIGLGGAPSTEAIFLQGYGVLFLMNVDFPLSPSVEEEKETERKTEEQVDELWKETRQEIYEPEKAGRTSGGEEEEEYDEKKVEEMKETLIKALKHASNIRNLKADESVILTVTGSGDSSGIVIKSVSGANQVLVKGREGRYRSYGSGGGGGYGSGYAGPSLEEAGFSSAVMTIRVKKSDVDAFVKGRLGFDEFRQKVQIFTY